MISDEFDSFPANPESSLFVAGDLDRLCRVGQPSGWTFAVASRPSRLTLSVCRSVWRPRLHSWGAKGLAHHSVVLLWCMFSQILYTARSAAICFCTLMDNAYSLQHPNYYISFLDCQVMSSARIFIQLWFKLILCSHSCSALKLVCQCWPCRVVGLGGKNFWTSTVLV
jgi:hypothetical protein